MPRSRTSRRRSSARTSEGPLILTGPLRNRSKLGIACTWRHLQQRFELRSLGTGELAAEQSTQMCVHALTLACHETLEHTGTRQQHRLGQHPARGSIEQVAGPVRSGPALRV